MDITGLNRFPGDADDADLRLVLASLAKAAEGDLDTWGSEQAAQVERLAQWIAATAQYRGPNLDDPEVRHAVQAYIRLTNALEPILTDPAERLRATDYTESLTAAAYEANAAMRAAGILGLGQQQMTDLARQLDPTFDTKG